ncbi:MAG: DUF2089 domain-containing protein [Chloroflexi bacterium]|nr:DUF2089 domain-containing protein [Chloroflexota bacterium]
MNKLIEKCPICANQMVITKLYCGQCGTTLAGQFGSPASVFSRLNDKQTSFLLTFIRCEGKFNRMEEQLGISYPTLKNRFNDILAAMGFCSVSSQELDTLTPDERIEILQKLDRGELKPEEAEFMLRGGGLSREN